MMKAKKKKKSTGDGSQNHNIEQKKPVTEYPENESTYVNFKTGKITLICILNTLLNVLNFTVKTLKFQNLF